MTAAHFRRARITAAIAASREAEAYSRVGRSPEGNSVSGRFMGVRVF
jgi:hypothetical protein